MPDHPTTVAPRIEPPTGRFNVADRLATIAAAMPDSIAVAAPDSAASRFRWNRRGDFGERYATITFAELDAEATRIARGLASWGVPPGTRLALLVRPGIDFVGLVFGLLRAGMVIVLVDPGLGRRNAVRCLAAVEPAGFIAIPVAHALRTLLRHKFPRARWNVTVGRHYFWGGITLEDLRQFGTARPAAPIEHRASNIEHPASSIDPPDSPAAIIFTSGSTGPPKGVLYTHRMFDTQVAEIQATYNIEPGGTDLACFPLFGLFNAAMGVTTVFPEMDFSRPASADPRKLLAAANLWHVTQAFASPAVWRVVGDHCAQTGERIDSLRQVFSCGAPVQADVIRSTLACIAPGAHMHTPYGATECLPVATIEGQEILSDTAARTDEGAGVCVGRKFDSIDWRVIRITDEPIAAIAEAEDLPAGQIGELIVRGPQVSPEYVTQREYNALAKIVECGMRNADSGPRSAIRYPQSEIAPWHRTGDVGYFDPLGRFWYCGRKSHRVETDSGIFYTECIEQILNRVQWVRRTALVGIGDRPHQTPVIVFELNLPRTIYPDPSVPNSPHMPEQLVPKILRDLKEKIATHAQYTGIRHFLRRHHLPVDIRHNAKINREQLAIWAARHIHDTTCPCPKPVAGSSNPTDP